jgi:hypothetical protein
MNVPPKPYKYAIIGRSIYKNHYRGKVCEDVWGKWGRYLTLEAAQQGYKQFAEDHSRSYWKFESTLNNGVTISYESINVFQIVPYERGYYFRNGKFLA